MFTILCYIYFFILTIMAIRYLYRPQVDISSPYDKNVTLQISGIEMLLIFIFGTGLIALMPVLSIRLAVLEVLCIIGIFRSASKPISSLVFNLWILFFVWVGIGLFYSVSPMYGIRMILKYIYPFLVALFASAVVRDEEIFLKATLLGRKVALFSLIVFFIPGVQFLFSGVFWNRAAVATHYITLCMFSLGLFCFSDEKRKNLICFFLFLLPCYLWVFRTNIMGSMIALAIFVFIRYRFKSIPFILVFAFLSIASIFYIPSVKKKMYFRPDEVTMTDFLTGNVDEDNINTSGRKNVWKVVTPFYENNKLIGAGTGTTQDFTYNKMKSLIGIGGEGAQIHSDFLLLLCDNGIVGLILYLLPYIAALFHCLITYRQSQSNVIRLCAVVTASSMFGILVTMYSDNTVSYSMATLSYPWGLYGMMLGLKKTEDDKER